MIIKSLVDLNHSPPRLIKHRIVIIDGYSGVFFDMFQEVLDRHLKKQDGKDCMEEYL